MDREEALRLALVDSLQEIEDLRVKLSVEEAQAKEFEAELRAELLPEGYREVECGNWTKFCDGEGMGFWAIPEQVEVPSPQWDNEVWWSMREQLECPFTYYVWENYIWEEMKYG